MSYPPPPGASGGAPGSGSAHPSLPSRPPQGRSGGFKSAFSKTPASAAPKTYGAAPTNYGAAPMTYGAAPTTYGAAPTTYDAAPTAYGAAPTSYGAVPSTYGRSSYGAAAAAPTTAGPAAYPGRSYGQYAGPSAAASSYGPSMPGSAASSVPSMRNPFPAPAAEYNADMAAQIAQWQSAYGPRDPNAPAQIGPVAPGGEGAGGAQQQGGAAAGADGSGGNGERKKTVYREGGGKKWQDDTLMDWDPAHLRLFVGNLAGETTDESLLKAFSRWKSVQKARVIREKRTSHSKQYGFVSFSDADDFFQAAKEMNGKYIQSHPVVVRKAKTEIKVANVKDHKNKGKWGKNNHHKNAGGDKKKKDGSGSGVGGGAGGYEPGSGPVGAGVTKPGQKMKNGLRLLG